MTSQASIPKITLRSSSDLVAWDKQQKNTFLKYGPPGDAIRQKQKHVQFTPKLDDMVLDHLNQPTRSPKYPVTNDQIPVLTPAAVADWNRDSRFARDLHEKMLIYHGEIISGCLEHVGHEVKESLEAEVNYEQLITSRDSFDF